MAIVMGPTPPGTGVIFEPQGWPPCSKHPPPVGILSFLTNPGEMGKKKFQTLLCNN
jgi:hypothetical protein